MKYTVLLLRPDYAAGQYGEDTYLAHVEADTVGAAQEAAQAEASAADDLDSDPADYAVLLVFEGHHNDLKED